MRKLAIIGATGYIGSQLLNHLNTHFLVTALTRNNTPFAATQANCLYKKLSECEDQFDVIINTSYSLHVDKATIKKENVLMSLAIKKMAHFETHIIHLSSLAVFGFGLDREIQASALKNKNDYNYVQSKLEMENLLLSIFNSKQLSIVRLGNVWGPENNSWTQPIADALTWQLPVMPIHTSFSNITFIQNTVSYIHFVIKSGERKLFHHLAEFSALTWGEVIESVSIALNRKAPFIEALPPYPKSLLAEFQLVLNEENSIKALKKIKNGRFTSACFIKILNNLANISNRNSSSPSKGSYTIDPVFYWVLTCNTEFKNEVLPEWKPIVSFNNAMALTNEWLSTAGYNL